ncbi:type II toxin-antitoxin system PemK/MazF family toxin [Clostridium sp.]|uniref:type II toxin-antitoxin system PemK/MazF family toxin n=1 Tax=Clostridium sp. TaxID=1506 RepID=UPI001A522950|nr:type II toxin-antitoxin system PemK/MazF family toxin [Clostridium sp.]MBK5239826.1 type II toxin-antitoxin system PemK/MazF family toxin [Clostridium sp.]
MSNKYYKSIEDIKDNRTFIFGQIWQVKDELISIPNADRLNNRNLHFSRCIIIVQNNLNNFNPESVIISVAPISSRTDCERENDVILLKDKDEVKEDSIIMLDYIQPLLKIDLYRCVGEISEESKYDVYFNISNMFGYASKEVAATEEE